MRLQSTITFITCLAIFISQVQAHSIRPRTSSNTINIENVTIHTPYQRVRSSTEFNLTFILPGQDNELRLSLEPNHDILAQGLHTQYVDNNGVVQGTETVGKTGHRVFKGRSLIRSPGRHWKNAGWARIYMVRDGSDPLFEGAFAVFSQTYHVKIVLDGAEEISASAQKSRMVVHHDFPRSKDQLFRQINGEEHMSILRRQSYGLDRDDLIDTIGSTNGCPNSRRVAVIGIATDCTYTSSFDSSEDIRQNLINMVNIASEVFENAFNISLAIHNLTISDAVCPENASGSVPWNVGCSTGNLNWRLRQFSSWRGSLSDTTNAYWTLMTGCSNGQEVGVSWNGQLCDSEMSTNVVARTINQWQVFAHESAHTFGAFHDCESSLCSSGSLCCPLSSSTCDAGAAYLMNPFSTSSETEFSPCTIGNVCSMLGSGYVETTCLRDNNDVPTITAGECGNGIVEEGEDCDCGDDECSDCCDGSVCRFREGAVCDSASGTCCTDCQFASAGTVCRAITGSCDLQETCSGDSGICPEDRHAPNGDSCGNDSSLFCASGQCTNRDIQCQELLNRNETSISSCDTNSCTLRCSTDWYGSTGYCTSMDQSVLNGTPCNGGLCENGQCQRDDGSSWVDEHRPLVIGLAAGIGGALILAILFCIICCCCCRRNKGGKKVPLPAAPALNPIPPPPPHPAAQYGFGTSPRYA